MSRDFQGLQIRLTMYRTFSVDGDDIKHFLFCLVLCSCSGWFIFGSPFWFSLYWLPFLPLKNVTSNAPTPQLIAPLTPDTTIRKKLPSFLSSMNTTTIDKTSRKPWTTIFCIFFCPVNAYRYIYTVYSVQACKTFPLSHCPFFSRSIVIKKHGRAGNQDAACTTGSEVWVLSHLGIFYCTLLVIILEYLAVCARICWSIWLQKS